MEHTVQDNTDESTIQPSPQYEFSAFQQWEIAFIYAFAVTFNPHQEIAPSFYRLPEFTPKVSCFKKKVYTIQDF